VYFLLVYPFCCGFFLTDFRWSKDSPWNKCGFPSNLDCKKIVEKVMEHYTKATDGSFTEEKYNAVFWQHQDEDDGFGPWQAKQLLDHLKSILADEPVIVKRGQHTVEVQPQVS